MENIDRNCIKIIRRNVRKKLISFEIRNLVSPGVLLLNFCSSRTGGTSRYMQIMDEWSKTHCTSLNE